MRRASERRLADAATNRMMHLLRCLRDRYAKAFSLLVCAGKSHDQSGCLASTGSKRASIRLFKSDQPVLRLPLLIWKLPGRDRQEPFIVLHRFLVLMQIIVSRCAEEVTSRVFVGEFCSDGKRLQHE